MGVDLYCGLGCEDVFIGVEFSSLDGERGYVESGTNIMVVFMLWLCVGGHEDHLSLCCVVCWQYKVRRRK